MYIKDYPYAGIVEETRVLECFTLNFNPLTKKRKLNEKFIGTFQAMTEDGPAQKFHFKPGKELVIQSPEGEEKGTWGIEEYEDKDEKKQKPVLGITIKSGNNTQRYLCAFYHEEGVMMLVPSKRPLYSLNREDYDFGSCLFLVRESSRTGQLRCKTIEEVYDFVKKAVMHKMEDEEIVKIVITKLHHTTLVVLSFLMLSPFLFVVLWAGWFSKMHMERPFFGLTEAPPFWVFIVCIAFMPLAAAGIVKWTTNDRKKKIADFRQTRPNEIPDVSERWEA